MVTNPFTEAKPIGPALLGAGFAGVVTGLFGLLLLFAIYPPVVRDQQNLLYLDLTVLGQTLVTLVRGDMCEGGLANLLAFACRLNYASGIMDIIVGSRSALLHVATNMAAICVAFLTSFILILNATPKREQLRTLKGLRPLFDADGRAGLRATIARAGAPSRQSMWLTPHVQLNDATEGYNVLALGPQGSGKSSTLRALTSQAVARCDHTLVHDVKGDVTAGLPIGRFILVAPHDRRSAVYDIADDVRNRQHAREFAAFAVPVANDDPMWGHGTRAIWTDLVMVLVSERPGRWTWGELRDLLLSSGTEIKETLEKHQMVNSAGRLVFGSSDPEENRTTMSLLLTMWVAALTTVVPLADAWQELPANRRFSLRRWLITDTKLPRVIIVQKSSEYAELSALLGGFLIDRLIALALRPGRKRKHDQGGPGFGQEVGQAGAGRQGQNPEPRLTLCLDELPELGGGQLKRLANLLNVGREFGVVTLGAVQDPEQLIELFGENMSEVVLNRFRIKLVHQLDAGTAAERFSKLLGERRVEFFGPRHRDPVTGRWVQDLQRDVIPVVSSDFFQTELGVRKTLRGKVVRLMVMGLGNPAIVDVPLTTWPNLRPGFVPAPWTNE
jgi:hypothetical protein